jgi:hypothetical protein
MLFIHYFFRCIFPQLDLNGVLHSINAPDNWYGSTGVLDQWHEPMLELLSKKATSKPATKKLLSFFDN